LYPFDSRIDTSQEFQSKPVIFASRQLSAKLLRFSEGFRRQNRIPIQAGAAACLDQEKYLGRIRVLLADDHDEFLAVAGRLLESDYEIVKTVSDGQAVVDEATTLAPDLIILDITMPVLNGIAAARRLRAAGFTGKMVFLTVHGDADYESAAVAAGAQGFVVKSRLASDLLPALREVLAGRLYVSPYLAFMSHESDR
jgi:CheY-like chemotaxis protein